MIEFNKIAQSIREKKAKIKQEHAKREGMRCRKQAQFVHEFNIVRSRCNDDYERQDGDRILEELREVRPGAQGYMIWELWHKPFNDDNFKGMADFADKIILWYKEFEDKPISWDDVCDFAMDMNMPPMYVRLFVELIENTIKRVETRMQQELENGREND